MDELKNTLSYQVYFTSNPTTAEKNLFLTFFFKGNPIPVQDDKNILPLLSKATQIADNSFRVPNIVDITLNADYNLQDYYSSFFCVMFSDKKARKKEIKEKGLLIGKSIHEGYFIIGLWPYLFFLESESELDKIGEQLKEITNKAKNFSDVLLLTER